jgi:uncharacterized protein with beta-barrel porin domain
LTLSATNTYTNTTAITGGTLLVDGVIGPGAVTVTGGTLGGNGTIRAPVTVQSGSTLAPGNGVGQLTVSNSLTLQAGSTTRMEINPALATNDQVRVTGTLTYAGTLIVTNFGGTPAAGDNYVLFSAPTYAGVFSSTNLPPLPPGLGWKFISTNGTLSVIQTAATYPTNLTMAVNGSALEFSWPADHIGWRLQVQTNSSTVGLGTNWWDIAGSTATNWVSLPMGPANENVFYRMIFP